MFNRYLSSLALNSFVVEASVACCGRLVQYDMMLQLQQFCRTSSLGSSLYSSLNFLLKTVFFGLMETLLLVFSLLVKILYVSIISPLLFLFSIILFSSFNIFNLPSQLLSCSPTISLVARRWTFSKCDRFLVGRRPSLEVWTCFVQYQESFSICLAKSFPYTFHDTVRFSGNFDTLLCWCHVITSPHSSVPFFFTLIWCSSIVSIYHRIFLFFISSPSVHPFAFSHMKC